MIEDFKHILKPNQVETTAKEIVQYGTDRTGFYSSNPLCVLFPESTADVSAILRYCSEKNYPVVPSAGRTGLSGAAVAQNKEVIISFERMNSISDIDILGETVEAEAGVILENLQQAVQEKGLYFPLDFAAKGSCMIGGCISTNAGGVKVLKYGMTRNLVLGLEVVLANGTVLNLNTALIKDNSGYDLKQLFIGAEGTLGLITKARLKCIQPPTNTHVALLQLASFDNAPKTLAKMQNAMDVLAFEYMDAYSVSATLKAMPQLRFPFDTYMHTVLVEVSEKNKDLLEELIFQLAEQHFILDGCIASNSAEEHMFWSLRESASDSIYLNGTVHANDISVPISNLTHFLAELEILLRKHYTAYAVAIFGHIGDGNLHIYIIDERGRDKPTWKADMNALDEHMFTLVQNYQGSISAEHGIGLLKKGALTYRRSEKELQLMRQLKATLDPFSILNPGKIL